MTDAVVKHISTQVQAFTPEQRELIKRTVAPNASDDELAMFLHIAQRSGLDPLRRQMHFLKHSGRVTIVADVNGLQARAAKEPDFEGLLHAVVYEKDAFEVDNATGAVAKHTNNPLGNNGKIIGAWATVKRRGMLPFTAVVRFSEYENSSNPLWKQKPGVMIDKVAKSTALRLAYPEQLGGIYDSAELPEEEKEVNPRPPAEPKQSRVAKVAAEVAAKLGGEVTSVKTVLPFQRLAEEMQKHGIEVPVWLPELKKLTGKTSRELVTNEDVDRVCKHFFPEPPVDANGEVLIND